MVHAPTPFYLRFCEGIRLPTRIVLRVGCRKVFLSNDVWLLLLVLTFIFVLCFVASIPTASRAKIDVRLRAQ